MGICFSDDIEDNLKNRFDNGKVTKVYKLDNLKLQSLNFENKYEISGKINVFSAKNNLLSDLSQEFFNKITEIKKVDLSYNQFKEFPNTLFNLAYPMKILFLTNNKIIKIPNNISSFIKLKELNLSSNEINFIPNEINNLKELETLDLSHNNIITFIDDLIILEQLSFLNLSYNKISLVPKNNWNQSKIIQLDLCYNNISNIPDQIFGESKVTVLKLTGNNLTTTDLKNLDSFPKYLERRKMLKDQGFKHDLNITFSLCGLD